MEAAAADGALRLRVTDGNAAGDVIEVDDELVIGRNAEGAGRLAEDIEISRRHARIYRAEGGRYLIEDLGSTNGTLLNGQQLSRAEPLDAGDRIELGGSTLVVQVRTPASTGGPAAQPTGMAPSPPPVPGTVVPVPSAAAGEETLEQPPASAEAPEVPRTGAEAPDSPPTLSLRLEVDFRERVARIQLEDDSAEVKLVYGRGQWRFE